MVLLNFYYIWDSHAAEVEIIQKYLHWKLTFMFHLLGVYFLLNTLYCLFHLILTNTQYHSLRYSFYQWNNLGLEKQNELTTVANFKMVGLRFNCEICGSNPECGMLFYNATVWFRFCYLGFVIKYRQGDRSLWEWASHRSVHLRTRARIWIHILWLHVQVPKGFHKVSTIGRCSAKWLSLSRPDFVLTAPGISPSSPIVMHQCIAIASFLCCLPSIYCSTIILKEIILLYQEYHSWGVVPKSSVVWPHLQSYYFQWCSSLNWKPVLFF